MVIINRSILSLISSLFAVIIYSYDSFAYEKNLSLSSVASFPSTINALKDRWFFCDKCLNSTRCSSDDIEQCKTITLPDRNEALNLAVGRANSEAVYFLVLTAKTDVNSTVGEYKETPLIVASYYGTEKHRKIAEFLISHGSDVNALATAPADTALITAIWKNNIEFAKLLLRHDADASLTASGKKEGYVCKYAIQKKQAEIIPYIPNCCSVVEQNSDWIRDAGYLCP